MSDNKALAIYAGVSDMMSVGETLARSGFFSDAKSQAAAVAKIIAGAELGFGPMASMTGVHVIKGRVTLSANLMAAAVKRSGRYNYRVTKHTDTECTIEFYENGEKLGASTFTTQDAKRAGLGGDNWTKYPRNMLFARALSNGVRWHCPDIFGGAVYTPDEFDVPVNEDGEVIDGAAYYIEEEAPPANEPTAPTPPHERAALVQRFADHYETPTAVAAIGLKRHLDAGTITADMTDDAVVVAVHAANEARKAQQPEQAPLPGDDFQMRDNPELDTLALTGRIAALVPPGRERAASPQQRGLVAQLVAQALTGTTGEALDNARHTLTQALFAQPGVSALSSGQASAMIDWLTGPDGNLHPCAPAEARALLAAGADA